jgi:hypothetical protein
MIRLAVGLDRNIGGCFRRLLVRYLSTSRGLYISECFLAVSKHMLTKYICILVVSSLRLASNTNHLSFQQSLQLPIYSCHTTPWAIPLKG